MNVILNIFLNLLWLTLILVGIVALLAFARFIWITARFTYVIKLQKYDEKKLEAEREYNKVSAEHTQIVEANLVIRKDYSDYVLSLNDAKLEMQKIKDATVKYKAELDNLKAELDEIEENEEPKKIKKVGRSSKQIS